MIITLRGVESVLMKDIILPCEKLVRPGMMSGVVLARAGAVLVILRLGIAATVVIIASAVAFSIRLRPTILQRNC